MLQDCRLCDDLCYVTEPWVQCQVCYGKGKQGNLGVLSQDCTACNGVGYTKPGMGINPGMGMYGMAGPGYVAPGVMPMAGPMPGPMPMAGPMPGPMPGVIPPSGQFGYGYGPRY